MHKNRFINKYTVLSFWLLFVISFVSWELQSNYFIESLMYTPSPEYNSRDDYFKFILNFEYYIIDGFSFLQILLPLIVSLSVINFAEERRGMFPYTYPRIKNYRKFVLSSMFEHAAVSSLVMTLAFAAYILFGLLLVGKYLMSPHDYTGNELFADVLGADFCYNHPVILNVLESVLKYVIFPFVYSFFTMAVTFYTDKKYLIISIPSAYYIILTMLFNSLSSLSDSLYFFFTALAPTYPITAQTIMEPPTVLIGVAYIPVIAFVAFTLSRSFKEREKIGV